MPAVALEALEASLERIDAVGGAKGDGAFFGCEIHRKKK